MRYFIYILSLVALLPSILSGCQKEEAVNPSLNVDADNSSVAVGEKVTFTINHNASALVVYNGEPGHIYTNSLSYLLEGVSQERIDSGEEFRAVDPQSSTYSFSPDMLNAGSLSGDIIAQWDDYSKVYRASFSASGDTQGEIVYDEDLDENILVVRNVRREGNYANDYIRIFPQMPITSNRSLTFKLRGTNTIMYDIDDKMEKEADEEFPIYFYVRLSCKLKEGRTFKNGSTTEATWVDNPNGLPHVQSLCPYVPTLDYQTVTFDLSQHIENYCVNNGIEEDDIEYIENIMFSLKPLNTTGLKRVYTGDLHIREIQFGGISYIDYATGESILIYNANGVATYEYIYYTPGNYNVTFVGSSNSFKTEYGGMPNESAANYDMNKQVVTIPIKVR